LPRSSGLDFGELFAFCDLHVSRWRLRRVANPLEYLSIPMYYDRQGFPLQAEHPDDLRNDEGWRMPVLTWAMKMQDPAYHRVAEDDFPDGTWLSTVWLGLDHSHGFGPPTIFETMYFSGRTETRLTPTGIELETRPTLEFPHPETGEMIGQLRSMTEEEALAGHHGVARRLRKRWEV